MLRSVVEIEGYKNVESTALVKFQMDEEENTIFIGDKDKFIRIYSIKSGKLLNYFGPFEGIKRSFLYCNQWRGQECQFLVPENCTLKFYK
jgi:hypothetical protein